MATTLKTEDLERLSNVLNKQAEIKQAERAKYEAKVRFLSTLINDCTISLCVVTGSLLLWLFLHPIL